MNVGPCHYHLHTDIGTRQEERTAYSTSRGVVVAVIVVRRWRVISALIVVTPLITATTATFLIPS